MIGFAKGKTSEFVTALREERKTLSPIAEQKGLPAAEKRLEKARDELREVVEAKGTHSNHTSQQEHDLREAVGEANQAVADLKTAQERAAARLKNIDQLLNATNDAERYRSELAAVGAKLRAARADLAQITPIEAVLQSEIEELKQKRAALMGQAGRDELAARLAGKPAVQPKGLAAIDEDLESRGAALVAAQEARTAIETSMPLLLQEERGARRCLSSALMRQAELNYYEMLPSILPVISRLVITGSDLRGYRAHDNEFIVQCDDKTRGEAQDALNRELNEAAASA